MREIRGNAGEGSTVDPWQIKITREKEKKNLDIVGPLIYSMLLQVCQSSATVVCHVRQSSVLRPLYRHYGMSTSPA
jgi:hypothetical protein